MIIKIARPDGSVEYFPKDEKAPGIKEFTQTPDGAVIISFEDETTEKANLFNEKGEPNFNEFKWIK
jgi:hypothetical protein